MPDQAAIGVPGARAPGLRRPHAVALLLSLLCPAVAAQEFPESPDDPSAFATVIQAREYDDRFETVEDLLHHAAGVRVRRFGGLGAYSTVSIRGSKAEQVLILLDGVRLNSTQRGAVDLSTLPLRTIERVEILRGGSARYGSDAVGGVISITSRRPEEGRSLDASVLTGSMRTLGADLLLSDGGERLRTSMAYSRLRSDNDFSFDRVTDVDAGKGGGFGARAPQADRRHSRVNADFVQDTGSFGAYLNTGPTSKGSVFTHLHRKDNGQPGSILDRSLQDVSDEQLSCPDGEEQYRRAILGLNWQDEELGPGAFKTSVYHRYERSELHDNGKGCDYFPALLFPDRSRSQMTENQTGLDVSFAARPSRLGPMRLANRSAVSMRFDHVRTDDVDNKRRFVGSFFTQQELRLFGGWLRLFPALGFEVADTSSGQVRSAQFNGFQDADVNDDAEWLPRIGVILDVAPGLRLKSNYARSYRRPTFAELFHPDYSFVRGNPELEPEESWDFDIGLELQHDGWGPLEGFQLTAAFFHRDIEEAIEWVHFGPTFMPLNTGASRVRGYEIQGSFMLWDRLDLTGNYTFLDTEIKETGSPLPHSPRNQIFGRATLRLGQAQVWGELTYEDRVYLNAAGRLEAPEATQIDAGVSLQLAELPGLRWVPPGLSMSVEGINLTSETRVDSFGLPLPDDTLWYLRLRLAPSR